MTRKMHVIPNINIQGFSKDGRTGQEILEQSGDVLKGTFGNRTAKTKDDVTTIDKDFIRMADGLASKTNSYPGFMPIRQAMYSSSALSYSSPNVTQTSPNFYSPIHTPVNWNIPTKRREVYVWNRFFSQNNATINASLRFYSEFPFSGFENSMSNNIRKEHYDKLIERLGTKRKLPQIAWEYFTMGDAFVMSSISCPDCNGWGSKQDGSPCEHPNGTIGNINILNPDLIDVKVNPIDPNNKIITMIPDETLLSIVHSKNPKEIYDMIPDNIKKMVLSKQPIPLSSKSIFHMKHRDISYTTYGTSIIAPLFPMLAYLDRLRQAQWAVAERHILPIKVCKVGNDQRPAGPADIADVRNQLAATANDANVTLVVHHAFCYDENTEVLTKDGWKLYGDVSEEEIMVYDLKKDELRFENFINRFEYLYEGKMYHFKNSKLDICVTPNHRMLVSDSKKDNWYVEEAQNLTKHRYRTKTVGNWNGDSIDFINIKIEEDLQRNFGINIKSDLGNVDSKIFMKFLGYYISEGYCQYNEKNRCYQITVSQTEKSPCVNDVDETVYAFAKSLKLNVTKFLTKSKVGENRDNCYTWTINNKILSFYFKKHFGYSARNKKVPNWIKNLSRPLLLDFLKTFNNGDASKCKRNYGTYYQIGVYSEKLAEDIYEIAIKCGFSPVKSRHSKCDSYPSGRPFVNFGEGTIGKNPVIKIDQIDKIDYKGFVWCFETSTGFFLTRRNGKITIQGNSLEFVGASGKVLQLSKEYDLVDKEIIKGLGVNDALLSGCIPEFSRILTNHGFKTLSEFDQEKHLVATLNPVTHKFEWLKATYTHVVDYNSEDGIDPPLVHFKNKIKLDNLFTTGHEMYVNSRKDRKSFEFKKIRADQVKHKDKFILKTNGWEGSIPENISELTMGIDLELFLQLSAYFITEGSFVKEHNRKVKTGETYICEKTKRKRSSRKKIGLSLVQSEESDIVQDFFELKEKINLYNFSIDDYLTEHEEKTNTYCFRLFSVKLSDLFFNYFGEYSENKKIPNWIKDLPSSYLEKFMNHLIKCDGNERFANNIIKNKNYITYNTTSKQLCEDVFEISMKLKNSPAMSTSDPNKYAKYKNEAFLRYSVFWSPGTNIGDYPEVRNYVGRSSIFEKKWKGKVWCVTVPPNHLILTENNGKSIWTGNTGPSYSSAAIGIEATIKRLKNVQNLFSYWITEYIFKPEAKMRGFYRQTKNGGTELDVPKIKWDDLNLRDETQKQNQAISLWEKQAISTQTLHEKLNFDYDVEVERIRMEQQYQLQMGIAPQGKKGGLGGGFGGGGGLGGLGGGGGGGADGMSGNLPGGQDGPGLPGDELAPSMSGGEGSSGAGSGMGSMESNDIQLMIKNYEDARRIKPKVHRPKKYKLAPPRIPKTKHELNPEPELYEGRVGSVNLTSLERILYSTVERGQKAGQLPLNFIWQQAPEPVRLPRIVVDGMFPDVKLVVQADGEQWHSSPKDIMKDKDIDARLSRFGWTVLRFTEEELENNSESILVKIIQTYKELKKPKQASRRFSFEEMRKIASYDYIEESGFRLMYSVNKEENLNLVDSINDKIHDHYIESMYDLENERQIPVKVASSLLEKEIDITSVNYYELPEDIQNEYAKLTIVALDEYCDSINNNKFPDNNFIEKTAKILFEIDSPTDVWENLSSEEKERYLIYPKTIKNVLYKEEENVNFENKIESPIITE